jgi:predicted nuclease of restriction endonuclease-like (RecB) superfamily
MRQFFDAYVGQPELSTLLRELPWSSNLHILTRSKRPEEREFYLRLATQQRWPVREVARQIDAAMFERAVLNPPKVSTALRESRPGAETAFRDAYVVEFLELPHGHREADLHKSLLLNMSRFLAEMGRDFCFAGSEVPLQVGGRDFALDLLFEEVIAVAPRRARPATSVRGASGALSPRCCEMRCKRANSKLGKPAR